MRWLKKLHNVLWELENLIFGKLGEVGNVMIHNSCETWFFHQNFLKIIYDAKQDIGTPPIQPVSHSSWWKWQKHDREAMHGREGLLLINKQPNKAEPGVINILHAVALHSAGWDRALVTAWLQNWEWRRIQMKMRERWRPTSISVQSSLAPWSFSLSLQLFFFLTILFPPSSVQSSPEARCCPLPRNRSVWDHYQPWPEVSPCVFDLPSTELYVPSKSAPGWISSLLSMFSLS